MARAAPYVRGMKGLLVVAIALASCRPTDGGSRGAAPPGGTSGAEATAINRGDGMTRADSLRVDSLLQLADAGRIQGSATAPVWLVEISDFQDGGKVVAHSKARPRATFERSRDENHDTARPESQLTARVEPGVFSRGTPGRSRGSPPWPSRG